MSNPKLSVAEICELAGKDSLADRITQMWSSANDNRRAWLDQKLELRNYVFATDTTTTSNATLPWKNKTTIPKLCQIRDNLHANYMSALFPTDPWLKWEGHSQDAVVKQKRTAIESYMQNKVRMSNLATTVSQLLYDYIDYGNVFYDTVYVNEVTTTEDGEIKQGYQGPQLVRISPLDIVFDPKASSFRDSWKITRAVKTIAEIAQEVQKYPELGYEIEMLDKAFNKLRGNVWGFTPEDMDKLTAYQVDGFSDFQSYLQSGYVEILEFEGSIYDHATGTLHNNKLITVIDRLYVVRMVDIPSWFGTSSKGHAGWRLRPDNLYAMGPLDNLVGMQYRIDHLENLKADAMDLAVHPPLVISGNVDDFTYQPGEEIYASEGGSVIELGKNLQGVIGANNEIASLELKMEEMAGAPKQAMGIRTPGEKTAFEVQTLEMAASRIFQNKIQYFEVNVLEPALNSMLELSRRNLDGADVIRVMDDDIGVATFLQITKQDITASGKLRPVGARHFAQQATLVQNLMGVVGSPLWQDQGVRAHISGKRIAKLVEELLSLDRFELTADNVQVMESSETSNLVHQAGQNLAQNNMTPVEAPDMAQIPQ